MHIEITSNGSQQMLISPENEMEEAFIKMLLKQDCEMVELRQQVFVLNKQFNKGILIRRKELGTVEALEVKDEVKA